MQKEKKYKYKKSIIDKFLIKTIMFLSPVLSDKTYTKLLFRYRAGYVLNLNNPRSFNEKLQWLKLYYRKPIMTSLVDKYEVKRYVKEKTNEQYIIPTLGVWHHFDEIDFHKLPNKFVLKTTHDQGGVVICEDKNTFDKDSANKILTKHLKRNFYKIYREWPYKNVLPRIIAEKYIDSEEELVDYKFYCFDGVPKVLFVSSGRQGGSKVFDFYDIEGNYLDVCRPNTINSKRENIIPENYPLMLEIAEKLSKGFPHLRVDLYNLNGRVYFGELTFFTGSGMKAFIPSKWDYIFGSYIKLPLKNQIK